MYDIIDGSVNLKKIIVLKKVPISFSLYAHRSPPINFVKKHKHKPSLLY